MPENPGHSADAHEYTLVVNGRDRPFHKKKAEYKDIVPLAYENPDYDQYLYTVTYFKGESDQEGDLIDGDKGVPVKDGTVFNVRRSDKS